MRIIVSIIAGLLAAWGIFLLDSLFINWIISDLTGTTHSLVRIGLWIVAIAWTTWLAILLGVMIGTFVNIAIEAFQETRKRKNRYGNRYN